MDEYHSEHPTAGVRTMRSMLLMQGIAVNEKRVRRLMRKMGIQAIYPQKKLTKQGQARHVHPYLLKGKKIDSPDQVWSTDITYVPMRHGYMYLYAVIGVHSRYIVGWRFSNTLDKSNCIELMEEMHCQARDAGNREHRLKEANIHRQTGSTHWKGRNKHKYGWPRKMQGQHLDRAFLADNKAGIHLPIPYGCGVGSACRNRRYMEFYNEPVHIRV